MSGGEPSSIKQCTRCAARVPARSKECGDRVKARFDLEVYGLILQPDFYLILKMGGKDASSVISEMASADL